jgi:hypothetical protein
VADRMPPVAGGRYFSDKMSHVDVRLREVESPTGTQQAQAVKTLTQAVETLYALQRVKQAKFTEPHSDFTGWRTAAKVNITSLTGRLEVQYGGRLNGHHGYFCFSVVSDHGTHVSRELMHADPAGPVAITGGTWFSPSGYKSEVVSVPADTPLTVSLELFAFSKFTYFFGGSILARVVL